MARVDFEMPNSLLYDRTVTDCAAVLYDMKEPSSDTAKEKKKRRSRQSIGDAIPIQVSTQSSKETLKTIVAPPAAAKPVAKTVDEPNAAEPVDEPNAAEPVDEPNAAEPVDEPNAAEPVDLPEVEPVDLPEVEPGAGKSRDVPSQNDYTDDEEELEDVSDDDLVRCEKDVKSAISQESIIEIDATKTARTPDEIVIETEITEHTMTLKELRDQCKALGLTSTGKKNELVCRLNDYRRNT